MTNPIILESDPEGKVKDGIVNENGTLYYYVEGQLTYAGLIQIDGSYYVNFQCQVITGRKYWITKTNNLLPEASYQFDANSVLQK